MRMPVIVVVLVFASVASAQWTMQPSNTTAGLRGIHNVGGGVVWASGTDGTVLRTTDGGDKWEKCATPTGSEKLDFRGVWAWDAQHAMAMSAGPGEQSRIYETTDGCRTWMLKLFNKQKDGFWDAMVFRDPKTGILIGDPVGGHFDTRVFRDGNWSLDKNPCAAQAGESAFAASNSSVFVFGPRRYIVGTGGKSGPRVLLSPLLGYGDASKPCLAVSVPIAAGNDSSGVFSVFFRTGSMESQSAATTSSRTTRPAQRRGPPTAGGTGRQLPHLHTDIAHPWNGTPISRYGLLLVRTARMSPMTTERPGGLSTKASGTRCLFRMLSGRTGGLRRWTKRQLSGEAGLRVVINVPVGGALGWL